jgi:acyl-coenzyme A thioesterase PaaI-like protein
MSISSTQSSPPPVEQPPKEQCETQPVAEENLSFWEKVEAYITRLSTKNNFWHRVCSLIWLPFAFRSGISMRRISRDRFTAVLPFKRSNRNFYNAMAGASLLGNSEVAAGMFLFKHCGSDYAVVCKNMSYKFLRPCYGPAIYNVRDAEQVGTELNNQMSTRKEFNITFIMDITQKLHKKGREVRVGRCEITFHCTPKSMMKERATRRKARDQK